MANSVFFSWQSDTPNKTGRGFLKDVLEEVCKKITTDTTLEEALRDVTVDSDTTGVPGQPPILQTIFNKIDAAGVFLADMTFAYKGKDGSQSPNPNVLIEYGWALKSLGHSRVLWVMNTVYGDPEEKKMPFDLAHVRWPIKYTLSEDATPEQKTKEKQRLVKVLTDAILLCLKTILTIHGLITLEFPASGEKDGPGRFRAPGESLGFRDGNLIQTHKEVFLSPGPAIWLRLFPLKNPQKEWAVPDLKEILDTNLSFLLPFQPGYGGLSVLRASDGIGSYREIRDGEEESITVNGVAFIFRTGEIWSIDTSVLEFSGQEIFVGNIGNAFVNGLKTYPLFLEKLGMKHPFKWKAGISNVKGRSLNYSPPPGHYWLPGYKGPKCASDLIQEEGILELNQNPLLAIKPFFDKLFQECGLKLPEHLFRIE